MPHSPLGASAAERWMKCPGSIALLNMLNLPETEEQDYQVEGTCAHAGLAWSFENGLEAWEIVGHHFPDKNGEPIEFTPDMSSAVQDMLDACRADYTDDGVRWVEYLLHEPSIHPLFMGTVDHAYLAGDTLIVSDFKYGQGIPVDVEENVQLLYYAYGLLQLPDLKDVATVKFRIVQPRAFHPDGPVREWTVDAAEVGRWAREELLPAMDLATPPSDREMAPRRDALSVTGGGALMPGDHCRFCPAKLVCPAMRGLFAAVAGRDASEVQQIDDATLDVDYGLLDAVMHYKKAVGEEMMRRLQHGHEFTSAKLVDKKADRVWKDGAEARFKAEFGDKAYSAPVLLTPPQMEKLDPLAKALVKEWAYSPKTGVIVAPMRDKRPAIKTEKTDWSAAVTTLKEAAE